jgi:hypothetical protein
MHQQVLVVLLVGLAAAAYGLDLSHAAQPSTEIDPRIFSFLSDLYAQVIYPPLNHVVTNLALLGAQVLAGISENGIPAPGGRTVHLSEAELRGFWDGLWNTAIKPPIENALTGLSLMVAQVFAGVAMNGVNLGLGKRDLTEAEMRGFLDSLTQALNDVYSNVIQKPLENALSGGALMLAQVLAGLGTNGVNLGVGKRDLTEAEMRGFLDSLTQALNDVYANVIQKPLENALSGGALMLAQVLAGLGTNGVNLNSLFGPGKRDLSEAELRGLLSTVTGTVVNGLQAVWNNIFQVPLESFVQNGALAAAQLFANLGTNGVNIGKRADQARGAIIDNLVGHATGLFHTEVKPLLENALNAAALHLAGVLANFSQNGIGRR